MSREDLFQRLDAFFICLGKPVAKTLELSLSRLQDKWKKK